MLTGKRIYLRSLERADLKERVCWINDTENIQTLLFDWPTSLSKTEAWYNSALMDRSKFHFSIVECDTDELVGMTGLLDVDRIHRRGQLYITIGNKKFRGLHLPDEVIFLVLEYAFEELGLQRIYLYTLPNNEHARKVYERNGFQLDGILRKHYFVRGKQQDLYVQSILDSEWHENQPKG